MYPNILRGCFYTITKRNAVNLELVIFNAMKKYLIAVVSISFLISCKNDPIGVSTESATQPKTFKNAVVDSILTDSISIRGIIIDARKVWYAANNGKYGFYNLENGKIFSGHVAFDTLQPEFRSIAKTKDHVFILNAGSPALLYKISKDGKQVQLVYKETDAKAFYDSMQFFNDNEGIAMGDPTSTCLSVITTVDGGETWQKHSCDGLPKVAIGEAAFAASNSNLIVHGNGVWMVSGGKKTRVFYSADHGKKWSAFDTPIVQGSAMTGIFTADFYDSKNGFIAGGDYEKPSLNRGNKAITSDGGRTWKLVAENSGFGYASCVQYVPNSLAKQLVCVGASGLQYSSDSGVHWTQLLKDKGLFTIRFQNDSTAFAAGKDKLIRIRFKY